MKPAIFLLGLLTGCVAKCDIDYAAALPSAKSPMEVDLGWNPIVSQRPGDQDQPLIKQSKDDPALKVAPAILSRLKSVIFVETPFILIEDRIFREGDELKTAKGEPLVAKNQAILKRITPDKLIVSLISLDANVAGQVDVNVSVPAKMRKDTQ